MPDFVGLIEPNDIASAALRGDAGVVATIASRLIVVARNNLVARPWGGQWLAGFKGLAAQDLPESPAGMPFGEAFEISAYDADREAAMFPSRVRFDDGSTVELPKLLRAQGEALLGARFNRRYGGSFPLLPKTLDVQELLSVQGHPQGHTEVYIIIDAEPGATLRLGFNRNIDADEIRVALERGLTQQHELQALLAEHVDAGSLHAKLAPWFAGREHDVEPLVPWLQDAFPAVDAAAVTTLISELKHLYWYVLDCMNAIEVEPGQVIYNATPARFLAAAGSEASAEVHALGNPERRGILALEIRRPGPTFRAWDNVRFPQREVDVAAAVDALNLQATSAADFVVERKAVAGRNGTEVSVDCEQFRVEHLAPSRDVPVSVPAGPPHSLHCIAGEAEVFDVTGQPIGRLVCGDSALVPIGVGAYTVVANGVTDIVRVTLTEPE